MKHQYAPLSTILAALFSLCFVLPAHADEASKQAKIEQLIQLTHSDRVVQPMQGQVRMMFGRMVQSMHVPEAKKAVVDKYESQLNDLLQLEMGWDSLKGQVVDIYSKNFSEEDLDGIIKFYKSPVGEKLINTVPKIMQETMQSAQARMQSLAPKMQKIAADMKAELEKAP